MNELKGFQVLKCLIVFYGINHRVIHVIAFLLVRTPAIYRNIKPFNVGSDSISSFLIRSLNHEDLANAIGGIANRKHFHLYLVFKVFKKGEDVTGFQHAMMEVVGVESPACPTLFIPRSDKHSPSGIRLT